MIQMNLHQMMAITGGSLVGKEARIQGVTTDSRNDCSGRLFVALKGVFHNGEDYCQQAVEQGAAAVMVSQAVEVDVPQLIVKDTLVAMQALANAWVKQVGTKVVAITGSNGKTTVKNMLFSVLQQRYQCHATKGNYNNEIGVPLSLLSIAKEDEVAVIEMGAAQVGDIAHLTGMIKPDISLVTNIGNAHVGRFGSEANIATAKAEIYQALDSKGLAVVNADSPYCEQFKNQISSRIITFGESEHADFRLCQVHDVWVVRTRRGEQIELNLPVIGYHNFLNATAVVAIAMSLRLTAAEIHKGLAKFKPEPGRLEKHENSAGLVIINDAYNANPASVEAAIDVLKTQVKPTVLILGDMAELGEYAQQMHQQVAGYAQAQDIDHVLAVGEYAATICAAIQTNQSKTDCHAFARVDELMTHLRETPPEQGTVLVKGSRSMRLERVVDVLMSGEVA